MPFGPWTTDALVPSGKHETLRRRASFGFGTCCAEPGSGVGVAAVVSGTLSTEGRAASQSISSAATRAAPGSVKLRREAAQCRDQGVTGAFVRARPAGHRACRAAEQGQPSPSLFVPLTVVLELEWVLRAFYRFETAQIVRVLEHLLGLGHVNTEESERIAAALPLAAAGVDFADALHLAGSQH